MSSVAFFEIEETWEIQYLKHVVPNDTVFTAEKLTGSNVRKYSNTEILSPFIYSTLTREVLSQMPKLRCIATRSTGFDHINMQYCTEKGITVCTVPSYGSATVAEHTFALILAISRKLIPSIEQTRKGDFRLSGLTGFELFGKTLGVVGAGNIGKSVIRIAQAFGMHVLVFTRHKEAELQNVTCVSFEKLLQASDIITFHVPLTNETAHMLHTKNVALCKKGSVLINTSRGGVIETQAIVQGLDTGIFSGAGLDVLEEECGVREERELLSPGFFTTCNLETQLLNHVLLERDNVLITPHNAFNSKESLTEILQVTAENIEGFLRGNPQNAV